MNEELKRHITSELIASRKVFNRLNYIIDEFKGFIYDQNNNYSELHNGKEIIEFIEKQDKRLTEIDNRPRDYSELYESEV